MGLLFGSVRGILWWKEFLSGESKAERRKEQARMNKERMSMPDGGLVQTRTRQRDSTWSHPRGPRGKRVVTLLPRSENIVQDCRAEKHNSDILYDSSDDDNNNKKEIM